MSISNAEQAALDFLSRGWSVIPIRETEKRPAVAWKAFQRKCASEETVHDWFSRAPNSNVAIVTGALSGLVVLDKLLVLMHLIILSAGN